MRDMYTGIFYVNAPTIGAETHLPFGGTKNTGNGHREACVQALDVFSRVEVDLHRLQRHTCSGPRSTPSDRREPVRSSRSATSVGYNSCRAHLRDACRQP